MDRFTVGPKKRSVVTDVETTKNRIVIKCRIMETKKIFISLFWNLFKGSTFEMSGRHSGGMLPILFYASEPTRSSRDSGNVYDNIPKATLWHYMSNFGYLISYPGVRDRRCLYLQWLNDTTFWIRAIAKQIILRCWPNSPKGPLKAAPAQGFEEASI